MSSKSLPENDAATALLLLAVNPGALKGANLRGMPDPQRDDWLVELQRMLERPQRKFPCNVSVDRLLGGLDFSATMAAGKPVFARGLLEESDGGVLVAGMAERLGQSQASIIGEALDRGEFVIERDGQQRRANSRFVLVTLDEGLDDEEQLAPVLRERMAFEVPVASITELESALAEWSHGDIVAARRQLPQVQIPEELMLRACQSATAFGIHSLRTDYFVLAAARASAALSRRRLVSEEDAALASRLVLAHRATCLPVEPEAPQENSQEDKQDEQDPEENKSSSAIPDDVIVESVMAALPHDVLSALASGMKSRARTGGRRGPERFSRNRGRPIGARQSDRLDGARLNILATLKAAVPWQTLRQSSKHVGNSRVSLRPQDLHVTRFKDRVETTTIFAVDASGSQAAQRLNEVKGAIELLLNDCYVRRDQVALIAFRKDSAEVLLEPTRALARVKKSLRALPGGGGTPLSSGLETARSLALSVSRHGRIPAIVLLTDGRANVAADSSHGAERAEADAKRSALLLRQDGLNSILVDTSRRPRPRAKALADAMGARYVPLPNARADAISGTVQRELHR